MFSAQNPPAFHRRGLILGAAIFLATTFAPAQVLVQVVPVPRHAPFSTMPKRLDPADTTEVMKALTDIKEDLLPGSTASLYHSVTSGNTNGPATQAGKADWLSKSLGWLNGTPAAPGLAGSETIAHRAVAAIDNALHWLDDQVAPELTMRTAQMADFQRALKAYQLFRQMMVMAKSWRGSLFQFDLLDVIPVFQPSNVDDVGIPNNGLRLGVRYKDRQGKGDLLANFGLDNPFIGDFDSPRLRYKGPRSVKDIGFSIEASPYDGTETESGALRIGKAGNELLDRVFFEGMMGRNMARHGVYFTNNLAADRPSPNFLRARAETARDIRMRQILEEADAFAKAYPGLSASQIMDHFKDEMEWWRLKPQALFDNQMQRLNRLRDELQPVHNDIIKLESADKLKEESDPSRKSFLEGVYNLYSMIGDSIGEIQNAATGDEPEGDNPAPRLLYKANVSYARSTHAAYHEALAIRRFLAAKIRADAQRESSQGFITLWKNVQERRAALAKFESAMETYRQRGAKVLSGLDRLGITTDEVIEGAKK